ncbi:hypothetical protein KSP40_PGU005426 [Platanthera guangdongensis]|uniref:Uncharacterized protein n=1 Tax=Platanthera guangdongensis TaxID=2320717 RepID=A0ABR2MW08_9ASPA
MARPRPIQIRPKSDLEIWPVLSGGGGTASVVTICCLSGGLSSISGSRGGGGGGGGGSGVRADRHRYIPRKQSIAPRRIIPATIAMVVP